MSCCAPSPGPNECRLDLLALESGLVMRLLQAITTVTFFSGDVAAAETYLRCRTRDIIALNPWLLGRLVRGWSGGRLQLIYPEKLVEDSHTQFLQTHDEPGLTHSLPYEQYWPRLSRYCVREGYKCVGQPAASAPLFRITLLRTGHASSFALVVSLSHVIGGGQDFYSLYRMLSSDAQPHALHVERDHGFDDRAARVHTSGRRTAKSWLHDTAAFISSPGTRLHVLYNKLAHAPQAAILAVPPDFIQREKQAALESAHHQGGPVASAAVGSPFTPSIIRSSVSTPGVDCDAGSMLQSPMLAGTTAERPATISAGEPLHNSSGSMVSTNDVLMSAICRSSGCGVGMMIVNLRGRIKGLTSDFAGNYQRGIAFQPCDFATPGLIRHSFRPDSVVRVHCDKPLPGFLRSLRVPIASVTNWVGFYHELQLPGGQGASAAASASATHVAHLPLFSPASAMLESFVIYRPSKDRLAVLALTRRSDPSAIAAALYADCS